MLREKIARLGQVFRYFFVKSSDKIENYAKDNLSDKEYMIFKEMGNYDKVHCYKCAVEVENKMEIFGSKIWIKAALLHDCGKDKNIGFLERVAFAVLKFDGRLKKHPENGYEKLKEINSEIAEIIRVHHDKKQSGLLIEFQKIDDLC